MGVEIKSCTTLSENVNPNLGPCSILEPDKVSNELMNVEWPIGEVKVLDESGNVSFGDKIDGDNMHTVIEIEQKTDGPLTTDSMEKKVEEKRKSLSAKKPPKPPRPPRGLSLDAADRKLVKEIAELAMIKRARIERIKALKKSKVAKASNRSHSGGSYVALLLTFLFFVLLVCHGISSKIKFHGSSLMSAPESDSRNILVENQTSLPFSRDANSSHSGSSHLAEPALGLDGEDLAKEASA